MGSGHKRKAWSSKKSLSGIFSQKAGISNALPVATIGELAAFLLRVLYGLFLKKTAKWSYFTTTLGRNFTTMLTLHSLALRPLLLRSGGGGWKEEVLFKCF